MFGCGSAPGAGWIETGGGVVAAGAGLDPGAFVDVELLAPLVSKVDPVPVASFSLRLCEVAGAPVAVVSVLSVLLYVPVSFCEHPGRINNVPIKTATCFILAPIPN